MRHTKARPQLEGLLAETRGWAAAVPERARRFHAVRRELDVQIGDALPFWKPWISNEDVDRFRDRVRRLAEVAEPLADLIRGTEALEAEVRRLDERGSPDDPELTAWLQGRCRNWLALLGRLGAHCDRDSDLYRDRTAFQRIESDVRLHGEAVHLLSEAQRVLRILGADVRATPLKVRLPDLRKRLFAGTAVLEDWLSEIGLLVQPLKVIADRVEDPPSGLHTVTSILGEARGWSKRLDDVMAEDVERLEERRFRPLDWTPAEVQELLADAEGLRAGLIERAQRLRSGKLQEIEAQLTDLFQACGRQADLEERLAALRNTSFNRPPLFRDWLDQFERFQLSFKAIAHAHIGMLEVRLAETVSRIERKIEELEAQPLSDDVSRGVTLAAHDLRQFPASPGAEEMLRRLREANAIARRLDQLAQQAEGELREWEERRQELAARSTALQVEARRVKAVAIEISGLASRIAALPTDTAPASHASRQRLVRELAAELEAVESAFVARCREQLAAKLAQIRRATDVLRSAHVALPPDPVPAIDAQASPRAAAQAVIDAARLVRHLLQRAREAFGKLEARAAEAHSAIASLRLDELAAGDRQTAEQLLAQLLDGSDKDLPDVLDRLELVAGRVEASDRFFSGLRQEEHSARDQLAELRRQLRVFHDEQLPRFCPELTDRVASLVYGVPEQPRHWNAIRQQLDRAADLFGRVDSHARRLAAEELGNEGPEETRLVTSSNLDVFSAAGAIDVASESGGKSIQLTLWGPSAAGKTVLLARLYLDADEDEITLRRRRESSQAYWEVFPTSRSLKFVQDMRARMKTSNRFPPATAEIEEIEYLFQHRGRPGATASLRLEDRAGAESEELPDGTSDRISLKERLGSADGIVLLFDPLSDEAILENRIWRTLEQLHVASGRGVRRDERPIAVCVSKADVLIRTAADYRSALDAPDEFVRHHTPPFLLRALERFCSNYRLFPVSAAGVRLRHGVIEPAVFFDEALQARICPDGRTFNLMAPFSWLLDELLGAA